MTKKQQTLFTSKLKIQQCLFLLSLLSLWSCAKDRDYDVLEKSADIQHVSQLPQIGKIVDGKIKSLPQQDNIYVSNTQGTARFNSTLSPYYQGEERAIKLFYTEDGIAAYQMERDQSFQDNIHNNDPVFVIPVAYKTFRCRENADNECTGIEEENTDANVEWYQKDHFIPDFAAIKAQERNSLGTEHSCLTESSSKLGYYNVSSVNIYFEVHKVYRFAVNNWRCISWLIQNIRTYEEYRRVLDEMDTASTTISYSIATTDSIASPNYKPLKYDKRDERLFGYFPTHHYKKDNNQSKYQDTFVNRWNPESRGGIIQYFMSKEFNKPENKYLRDATYLAFDRMNLALKEGGVNFRVAIRTLTKDEETTIRPGDLRYSMIVLVEDVASGLLGYGPSVANPLTGEIVKAHTNMYKGSLKSLAPRIYDGIIAFEKEENYNQKMVAVKQRAQKQASTLTGNNAGPSRERSAMSPGVELKFSKDYMTDEAFKHIGHNHHHHHHSHEHKALGAPIKGASNTQKISLERLEQHLKMPNDPFANDAVRKIGDLRIDNKFIKQAKDRLSKYIDEVVSSNGAESFSLDFSREDTKLATSLTWALDEYRKYESGLSEYRKNNMYHQDMVNFENLGKVGVEEVNNIQGIRYTSGPNKGKLKPWILLPEDKQRILTEKLVVHYYIPTLVHEIGHNLGLRHNFAGSFDKENFYSEAKRKKLGLANGSRYSSIMDYNYSSLNGLSNFGPYDIAAFRYAYNRDVQLESGDYLKLDQDGTEPLSEIMTKKNVRYFQYCTDQNAGASVFCDVFDEGSSFLELTHHFIDKHRRAYELVNVKGRRKSFSEYGHVNSLFYHFMSLTDLRRIHETWQFYYATYGDLFVTGCNTPQLKNQYGPSCTFIDEIVQANNLAGRRLLDIVKTPDLMCDVEFDVTIDGKTVLQDGRESILIGPNADNIAGKLANDKGEYRPHNCFDPAMNEFLTRNVLQTIISPNCEQSGFTVEQCSKAKVTVEVKGQSGRYMNDVDAATRKDQNRYSSDIDIRGFWPQKMVALHMLTYKSNMVSAGSNRNMSYVDHPQFNREISNLARHFAYGEPLQSPVPFKDKDGVEYFPTRPSDLNTMTKVLSYTNSIMNLFVPTSDTGEFNPQTGQHMEYYTLGKYMLRQMASSSLALTNNYDPLAHSSSNAFHDAITAEFLSTDKTSQRFGESIVKTYKFSGGNNLMVGATKSNVIAGEMIDMLKGGLDEKSKQINDILDRVGRKQSEDSEDKVDEQASIRLFNKVYSYKLGALVRGVDYSRVSRTFAAAVNATAGQPNGATQQAINKASQYFVMQMGQERFEEARALYILNNVGVDLETGKPLSQEEVELRKFDLLELGYATASDQTKSLIKKRIESGLYALQANRKRDFSYLFYYKNARDEQE